MVRVSTVWESGYPLVFVRYIATPKICKKIKAQSGKQSLAHRWYLRSLEGIGRESFIEERA